MTEALPQRLIEQLEQFKTRVINGEYSREKICDIASVIAVNAFNLGINPEAEITYFI